MKREQNNVMMKASPYLFMEDFQSKEFVYDSGISSVFHFGARVEGLIPGSQGKFSPPHQISRVPLIS